MNKSGNDPLKAVDQKKPRVLKSYTANPCLTKDKHPDIKNFIQTHFFLLKISIIIK